ncbi:unnamed protein product [Didymodactylos carnosus]|uniref:WW domain-binding protein 4 n=1 Tax=Didymodactylos carnosus TaxID=1234261 RepID=A0A814WTC0_9BILA|nr:unnamed protein product [Didymodactylos carnosus]CAF1202538.1 unnamed protein product [Didymodactylos carnosus]CAF3778644.1 unnamed protein product [Didymodactylos carnosus]CAF3966956.1 unnamed protein product [Didymodactylos carnosus]
MADYWKSNPRHYCKFCKCWLADNKISVEFHEKGNKHKENVKLRIELIRKTSLQKEKDDKKHTLTIAKIEQAALVSFQKDVAKNPHAASQYGVDTDQIYKHLQQQQDGLQPNLPSKLKRPLNEPVRITCKKPKFVLKTPTPKPTFISSAEAASGTQHKEDETKIVEEEPAIEEVPVNDGTWYETKTDGGQPYYWHDKTGETTWTMPNKYISIAQQQAYSSV